MNNFTKSSLEKEIRKKRKKIRRLKEKENWDVELLSKLDDEVLQLSNKILYEKKKFQENINRKSNFLVNGISKAW